MHHLAALLGVYLRWSSIRGFAWVFLCKKFSLFSMTDHLHRDSVYPFRSTLIISFPLHSNVHLREQSTVDVLHLSYLSEMLDRVFKSVPFTCYQFRGLIFFNTDQAPSSKLTMDCCKRFNSRSVHAGNIQWQYIGSFFSKKLKNTKVITASLSNLRQQST